MNYFKAIEIAVLRRIAKLSPLGSNSRRLYNEERLKEYRGHLMMTSDIEHSQSISRKARSKIVKTYVERYPELANKTTNIALSILNRKYKKNAEYSEYVDDILYCKFAYGIEPDEYISYCFFDKTDQQRKEFVSDREVMYMVYQMNDRVDIELYNDKAKTFLFFKPYYKRDGIVVSDPSDYSVFSNFVEHHPTFVKKKVNEAMGRGVELVTVQPTNKRDCFEQIIKEGKHLLEEKIEQDRSLSEFNESSVNTLRLITYFTSEGIEIPFAFAKFGRKGSFVDNGGSGGIMVGVDVNTGELITDGYDELGTVFDKHPDSYKMFKSFKLPEFDKVLSIAKEMSEKTPSIKYIGWDFAYTSKFGWVVVEGNGMSQLIGPQTVFQKGVKNRVNKIMLKMDLF